MMRRLTLLLLLLLGVALNAGCAAVGLTLLGVGAGISGGTGVAYTLDSIVYKTFSASEEGLDRATRKTLVRMDMPVTENQATESGRRIVAAAGDRTVEIEIDRLTSRTARMRVNVKRGWFFKDRATATEIIIQTERTLKGEPQRVRTAIPSGKPTALKE